MSIATRSDVRPERPPLEAPGIGLDRLRWLILALLFLSTTINYIDRQALSVLTKTLRDELGLTSTQYGDITSVFMACYTVGWVIAGVMIDKIGARIGFALSVLVWSVSALLHAFATGPLSLGIFRGLLGVSEAGNWPAGGKAIACWFPRGRRAFAMAIFDGGSAVGAITAPPLVGLLALHFGWRAAFVVTGLLGLIWLAGWLVVYHAPERHPWLTPEERARVLREVGAVRQGGVLGAAMLRIMRHWKLWGLMVTRLVATPVWWFYVLWLPDYFSKGRGFSLKELALFGWIPYLAVDLGKVMGGKTSDWLLERGRGATLARKSVMVCGALLMMGGLMVVEAGNAASAIAWVCVATFGFGMWSANILALHADMFPAETMGSAVGLTGMAASLSGAAFTFAVGRIVERAGYAPAFWAAGLLSLLACLALFFWVGRVEMIELETKDKAV